ncbi:MAG: alternative ribosome rescue aminoacyl-tRNA hydrolase ArfB [Spirochaetota bacterium]
MDKTALKEDIASHAQFSASRSQGPGGQSVNTTDSRVQVALSVDELDVPTQREKERIKRKLPGWVRQNKEGMFYLAIQNERSQLRNKQFAIERMAELILAAAAPDKTRKRTRPTKASRRRRLEGKRKNSRKKQLRKEISPDES